jgi:hypothetical protein
VKVAGPALILGGGVGGGKNSEDFPLSENSNFASANPSVGTLTKFPFSRAILIVSPCNFWVSLCKSRVGAGKIPETFFYHKILILQIKSLFEGTPTKPFLKVAFVGFGVIES